MRRLPIVGILTPRFSRRFWLSIGAGDFSISPKATSGTAFFVMIQEAPPVLSTGAASGKAKLKRDGVAEFCVDVPLKPPLLATLKSTNYLLNALVATPAFEPARRPGASSVRLPSYRNCNSLRQHALLSELPP